MKHPSHLFEGVLFLKKNDATPGSACNQCALNNTRICADEGRFWCGTDQGYFALAPTPWSLDRWALLKLRGEL